MKCVNLTIAAVFGAALFVTANEAGAICNKSGKIYRVTQYSSYAYIYLTPATTSLNPASYGYYYYLSSPV